LVVACSTDPQGAPTDASTSPEDDGGPPPDATTIVEAAADAGPVRAPFGLDARPTNTTCHAPARPPTTAAVTLQRVFANVAVSIPRTMAQAPGDPSRWFVASQSGQLLSFATNDPSGATTVTLDLAKQTLPVFVGVEDGFLGFAFHPDFAKNGLLFVSYTIS